MGGGIGMGNTCKPMAVSFQCMTKFTTNTKEKKKEKNQTIIKKNTNSNEKQKKEKILKEYTEFGLLADFQSGGIK